MKKVVLLLLVVITGSCNKKMDEKVIIEPEFALLCCSSKCTKGDCVAYDSPCDCTCTFWGRPDCQGGISVTSTIEVNKLYDIIDYLNLISPNTSEINQMINLINQQINILESKSPIGKINSSDPDYDNYLNIWNNLKDLSVHLSSSQNADIENI